MSSTDPEPRARILALEPWFGGSHRAFLEGLREHSRHGLQIIGLPARHWKWRMRGAPWQLARQLAESAPPDLLLVSDYLDLPGFLGLMPGAWSAVPSVLYFHENQLTYPQDGADRAADTSYGFTNVLSALRADVVLFNSEFHREEFTRAGVEFLGRLPRPTPRQEFREAMKRARVVAPGVEVGTIPLGPGNVVPGNEGPDDASTSKFAGAHSPAPLRILFPHRWEHDKNPLQFLELVCELQTHTTAFELVLLGEHYKELPAGVGERLAQLRPQIVHQGFVPDRKRYAALLGTSDVVVSTAHHEFFGMALVEALAAGVSPQVPHRLSYPEVLGPELAARFLYRSESELLHGLLACTLDPAPLRDQNQRRLLRQRAAFWSMERSAEQLDAIFQELLP